MTATLLELDALASGYGALQVLFNVSLAVREGEIVALMGSNGAGKTTTLRTIVGLLKPMSGRVRFDGVDITGTTPERLVPRGLVMVPEGRGMLRDLTVAENLELGAYTVADKSAMTESLERTFSTFPILAERRNQKAGTLSGGQQQMLALGRALMARPRLMLVDEASLGLSPVMTETAFGLIQEVNTLQGVSVLLVEQNVLALDLAHRAYVLEKGEIVASAAGDEVRRMQGRLREAYLGRAAVPTTVRT
ncbi:MAG: ABC transporter ATP-binding protein [Mycobacteriales bacterium]|nr:ABC transporter ATP-binding protein [Frankia sp.]